MENRWPRISRAVHHFKFCRVVYRSRKAGASGITRSICCTWAIVFFSNNPFQQGDLRWRKSYQERQSDSRLF